MPVLQLALAVADDEHVARGPGGREGVDVEAGDGGRQRVHGLAA
jgi:hypothetical protein